MIPRFMVAALYVLGSLTCVAYCSNVNCEATYISFAVPGALGTFPTSLNNAMAVTGYYSTSPSTATAFIRNADGTITTFSVPGALWTQPESVNDTGDITGFYELVSGVPHGFLRYADGRLITFDPPTISPGGPQTQPVSINAYDEVAGNYPFPNAASSGFARSRTGSFLTFDYAMGSAYPSTVTGLNLNGSIVGYVNYGFAGESYLVHPDGYMEWISVPVQGSISQELTVTEAINDDGVIAGWYFVCSTRCTAQTNGGFVRSAQGIFTLFNPPGPIVPPPSFQVFFGTQAVLSAPRSLFLNAAGVVAGSYTDSGGKQHGFVRNPYGTITSFDPPEGKQTTATSIDDGGAIAGFYTYNAGDGPPVGFIRVPQ